ncbi:hypothetical protein CANINC_004935 [Pichia inconspicua]|uniref:Xylanolytic transcriptional activator regulatory domain-containing protein n=1 Tax=Pichia inconspicua TaxID=52247 RepID=A0A4T0WUM4_9ASCO|nr:hypothetical protein CANINC_004935 [[Candida] inconspicua]
MIKQGNADTELQQLKSLNLIIKATFPEYDLNNLEHLKKIASYMNISIPELDNVNSDTDYVDSNIDSEMNITESSEPTNSKIENSSSHDSTYINQKIGLVGSQRIFNVLLELGAAENGSPGFANLQTNTHILPIANASRHLQSSIILTKIPIQECTMYMEIFFRDFHQSYFIFHEPVFRERHMKFIDYIRQNDLSSISKEFSNEETCSIYMVWILGRSCHLRNVLQFDNTREEIKLVNEPIIEEYFNVVKVSSSNCFFSNSLHSVRVLYLMGLHSMIKSNTEAAWYFWVNSCLKCCGLGFHTTAVVSKYSNIEQEEIKIIWWSCFKIHLNNSAIIGRLPVISLSDVDVELPLLEFKSTAFKNAYTYSIRLFEIMYLILKNRENLLQANELWTQDNMIDLIKIIGKLKSWKTEMVETLGSYSQPEGRYIIKLYLQYYYSSISLITPYLVSYSLQDVTSRDNINSIVTVLSYGIESAVEVVDVILFSVSSGNFNGVLHYDLFYAYNSLMVLLLYYSITKTSKLKKNPLELKMESQLHIEKSKILQSILQIRNVNKYHGQKTIGLNKFSVNINTLLDCFKLNGDNDSKENTNSREVPLINVAKLPQTPQENRRPSDDFLKDLLTELPTLPSPMLEPLYNNDDALDVDEGFNNFIKFISKENESQNLKFNDQVILEWNTNNDIN